MVPLFEKGGKTTCFSSPIQTHFSLYTPFIIRDGSGKSTAQARYRIHFPFMLPLSHSLGANLTRIVTSFYPNVSISWNSTIKAIPIGKLVPFIDRSK